MSEEFANGLYWQWDRGVVGSLTIDKYLETMFQDVILEPGDLLYNPSMGTHLVKSSSQSLAVSVMYAETDEEKKENKVFVPEWLATAVK
jgi:uncharacterized RmlC-like cupin family protein